MVAVGCRPAGSESRNSESSISASAATPTTVSPATSAPNSSASPAPAAVSTSGSPTADTARGTIQRVGNDPVSVLVLSSKIENTVFALRGVLAEQLGRAVGLDVMISGTRTEKRDYSASPRGATVFEVAQFFVRSADGEPAIDGVLGFSNGKYFLTTTGGERQEVSSLPQELQQHVGARVFLVGNLDKTPMAYGILGTPK